MGWRRKEGEREGLEREEDLGLQKQEEREKKLESKKGFKTDLEGAVNPS